MSWILFIFAAYGTEPKPPALMEVFNSYDACQMAGKQITSNIKTFSFKCIKVEK